MKSQDNTSPDSTAVTVGVEIADLSSKQAKHNICAAFYALDGEQSRHAFAQYISKEQQDTISQFKLEETLSNEYYTIDKSKENNSILDIELLYQNNDSPEDQLKLLLKNDEAVEFISTLITKARDDMSSCLGVNPEEIDIGITTSGKDGDKVMSSLASLLWHKDASDENPGMRLSMTLVGKPTLFSDDNPKIYIPSINVQEPGDGVDIQHINNVEEALPGEVAVFSMGGENGAAHAIPILDGPRLFVLLSCDSCPSIMHSKVNNFQAMINTIAQSAAPLIQQFNNTASEHALISLSHEDISKKSVMPIETRATLSFSPEIIMPLPSTAEPINSSNMISIDGGLALPLVQGGDSENLPTPIIRDVVQNASSQIALASVAGHMTANAAKSFYSLFNNETAAVHSASINHKVKDIDKKLLYLGDQFLALHESLVTEYNKSSSEAMLEEINHLKTLQDKATHTLERLKNFNKLNKERGKEYLQHEANKIWKSYKKLEEAKKVINVKSIAAVHKIVDELKDAGVKQSERTNAAIPMKVDKTRRSIS